MKIERVNLSKKLNNKMSVIVKVNNELIPHQSDETLVGSKEHQFS